VGSETRSKHGGFYTTEYGLIGEKKELITLFSSMEECRGIGNSFGFNRTEGLSDYSPLRNLSGFGINCICSGNYCLT